MSLRLSVVVFTYNEERNLTACLDSLKGLNCELFVVDSGSSDRTVPIAAKYGAKIIAHSWENAPKQWNWALRNLPFSFEWALWLDADHRLTPELKEELRQLFAEAGLQLAELDGLYVNRRQIFRGKWIKYGGYYPKYLLKLVRHTQAWCDEREIMDVRLYVKGRTDALRYDLVEDNQNESDILFFISKHTRFARLQAQEEFSRRQDGATWSVNPSLFGTPDQRVLWLRRVLYRLPLYSRPFLYFAYLYFIRLGFLDGKQGFIFHFLRGFWWRLIIDVVLDDLRRGNNQN